MGAVVEDLVMAISQRPESRIEMREVSAQCYARVEAATTRMRDLGPWAPGTDLVYAFERWAAHLAVLCAALEDLADSRVPGMDPEASKRAEARLASSVDAAERFFEALSPLLERFPQISAAFLMAAERRTAAYERSGKALRRQSEPLE